MNRHGSTKSAGGERFRSSSALALAVVLAASIVAGYLVFVNLTLAYDLSWDEARHTLHGALVAHDLRESDLLALFFDTYRQVYWPPLHSWLVGIAFLVSGPSLEVARAVSVLSFALLAPTVYLIARTVEPRHRPVAGCIAAALALTSPGLIELAAKGMLELPGLLALSITMLVYCRLERAPGSRPAVHALLGVCVVVTYLMKANYGILLVIAIVLARLIAVGFRGRFLLTKRNLYALLPLVLFCAVWFAYPAKVVWTWNSLVNQPWGGEQARGLQGWIFYPRVIVDLAGSWWMSAMLWAGLVSAWWYRRRPGVVLLALVALSIFVIGELHHTKLDRHIVPMFPSMFVLTGVAGAGLWERLRARERDGVAVAVVALAGVAFFHAAALEGRQWIPRSAPGDEVMSYVSAQLREGGHGSLVLGTKDALPSPPMIDWNLVSEGLLPVTAAGVAIDPQAERRLARAIGGARVPESLRSRARRLLDRYDRPARTRSFYPGLREPQTRAELEAFLDITLRRDAPRTIVAIIGTPDSTRSRADFFEPTLLAAGYRQESAREFPEATTRVVLYRRP